MSAHAETLPQIDLRGLDPPEPMRRALEAVEGLPIGEALTIVTDREPLLLYRELKRRGYRYIAEKELLAFHTVICRSGGKRAP
jgi:uncharacterized protein (DUF2249 family)